MTAIELRPSQADAWRQLHNVNFGIVNAPTGWGKSLTLCTLVGNDKRVIFAIPQKIIAKGFIKELAVKLPNGQTMKYAVTHNLCEHVGGAKLKLLKDWLVSDSSGIVVTTHQALAILWGQLSEDEKIEATADTTYVIDEAHHIRAGEEDFNQIGALVRWLLEKADDSLRLLLATAYFFRGDELPIIPEDHLSRFKRFFVPFDEWWASLKHLKSYRYDFLAYKGTPWKEIEKLLETDEPTLFFVPWEGHRLFLGKGKQAFVDRLVRLISKKTGASVWRGGVPIGKVIVNLVEKEYRPEKVRFVFEHGDKIAAILTVGMFREGADWVQCSRVIDVIPTSSNQDRLQRFGRLIRDFPGKKAVAYYSLFPHISDYPKDKQRQELTRLYAHFHASLVLENALAPIKIPIIVSRRTKEGDNRGRAENLIGAFDEATQEEILADAHGKLIELAESGPIEPSQAQTAVESVLSGHGIKRHREEMARQIVLILRRRANADLPVDDLVKAGFDKVWADDALRPFTLYSAGVGGPNNFKEIRRVIVSVWEASWLENYEHVRCLPGPPPANTRAGWWSGYCRARKAQGDLSPERSKLLEAIPWWSWREPFANRWQINFERVSKRPTRPRTKDMTGESEKQDFNWVRFQQIRYAQGKLSAEQIAKLEAIPWWMWLGIQDSDWEKNFAEVSRFHKRPSLDSGNLGRWIHKQMDGKQKGLLSEDRIKRLESISWWKWVTPPATRNVAPLRSHRARPRTGDPAFDLMRYFATRRKSLPSETIRELESIPWWSWPKRSPRNGKATRYANVLATLKEEPRGVSTHRQYLHYLKRRQLAKKLPAHIIKLLEQIRWWSWERPNDKLKERSADDR
jgi:hypothetical protein